MPAIHSVNKSEACNKCTNNLPEIVSRLQVYDANEKCIHNLAVHIWSPEILPSDPAKFAYLLTTGDIFLRETVLSSKNEGLNNNKNPLLKGTHPRVFCTSAESDAAIAGRGNNLRVFFETCLFNLNGGCRTPTN